MTDENPFKRYLETKTLFIGNRELLRPSYVPEKLPHREKEIDHLAGILSTALKGARPSNVLIFGTTGTGKTAVIKYLERMMREIPRDQSRVEFIYLNCKEIDTPYGILQTIGNRLIPEGENKIPFTGWPLDKVFSTVKERLCAQKKMGIVVLDEIDHLVQHSGDDVLYQMLQINDVENSAGLSLIGISNNIKFSEWLDARVHSRLGEERMQFDRYDKYQLFDILSQRIQMVFRPETVEKSAISLCASLAAGEGDARKALELLRIAAELAERNHDSVVTEEHVRKAKDKHELDCTMETIRNLGTQSKLVLLSIIHGEERGNEKLTTGEVYLVYRELCRKIHHPLLTPRRVTELLSELDMLGLIRADVKSFGRGGRTKEIRACVPLLEAKNVLEEDEFIAPLKTLKSRFKLLSLENYA